MRAILTLLLFLGLPAFSLAEEEIVLVVNKDLPVSQLSVEDVTDFYLKRRTRWSDGTKVQFIDQRDSSSRKEAFLSLIGRSQREVDSYWIGEKNFTGQSAPIQAPSDSMVISIVASLPGGIGYVSVEKAPSAAVKFIPVQRKE